jgi:hypothetical protein
MLFTLCLAHQKTLPNHCITNKELAISIGFNPWSFTPIGLFKPCLGAKYMEICNNYNSSKTLDEAIVNFEVVRCWWHSFGIGSRKTLKTSTIVVFVIWRSLMGKFCFKGTWNFVLSYFISYLFTNITKC